MRVIPVIDLKAGLVVRARAGDRANYRPIASPLVASAAPADVVAGLMRVHAFDTLYIADLDAIEGGTGNRATAAALLAAHPGLVLWLDEGAADAATVESALALGVRPVIGSESQRDLDLVRAVGAQGVLSLDFRDRFVGPAALLERSDLWPDNVIVMTLARVGVDAGPDLDRLRAVKAAAPTRNVFAAGGVRGEADLMALREAGVAGALVATAVHDGRLDGAVLTRAGTWG